jgi:hypothetical protein
VIVYVAHKFNGEKDNIEKARRILRHLQMIDRENCYVCPLTAFEHLAHKEIGQDLRDAVRLDLLSVCDILLIASNITDEMRQEIEFAKLVGMEVEHFEG